MGHMTDYAEVTVRESWEDQALANVYLTNMKSFQEALYFTADADTQC